MVTPSLVALIVSAAVMMASACFSAAQDLDTLKARHVLLIVLENEDFSKVVEDPYFDKLRTRGKWFSNSQAITHPSYPNYLALVAGDTFGVKNDHLKDFHDPDPKKYATIADLLEAKHLTWKSYAQGYPGSSTKCDTVDDESKTRYARKHVPLLSFKAITTTARCRNVVDANTEFDPYVQKNRLAELKAKLPNFAFYTPVMDNDGHNTSLKRASQWLESILDPLLNDTEFMRDVLIVVTFDESATHHAVEDGHIFTVMLGPMLKPGEDKTRINHYTVLRTIESIFTLPQMTENDRREIPIPINW